MSQTFLTLSPEQGGTRFGPFGGTINLGSDAARCQIVLQPVGGVQPIHALVTDTGSAWQVQPAGFGCVVFLRKPNGRILSVNTAVQASPGDSVIVGSQGGPAFTLSRAGSPASATPGGPTPGRRPGGGIPGAQHLNANAYAREAKRQASTAFITQLPYGREIYRWWTRYRSGAMFRPRYVIGAIAGVLAFFGLGCVSCFGLIAALLGLR